MTTNDKKATVAEQVDHENTGKTTVGGSAKWLVAAAALVDEWAELYGDHEKCLVRKMSHAPVSIAMYPPAP